MDYKWRVYLVQVLKNKIVGSTPAQNKLEQNESNESTVITKSTAKS